MATADLEFSLTVNGSTEQLKTAVEVISEYNNGKNNTYISCLSVIIGGENIWFSSGMDKIISEIENGAESIAIAATGPYGRYCEIDDVDIFRDLAEAIPDAEFYGHISGNAGYADQELSCELKEGVLHVETFYLSDDDSTQSYIDYFCEEIPYDRFVTLFQLDREEFDKDAYEQFICDTIIYEDSADEALSQLSYEDFLDAIETECPLTEEEFATAVEELTQQDIIAYYDFLDDVGDKEKYDYDPVKKEYIGKNAPFMKAGEVCEINDVLREQLEKKGQPGDDAALAALSVEEAYELLAAAMDDGEAVPRPTAEDDTCDTGDNTAETVFAGESCSEESGIEENCTEEAALQEGQPSVAVPEKKSKAWLVWLIVLLCAAGIIAAWFLIEPFREAVMSLAGSLYLTGRAVR